MPNTKDWLSYVAGTVMIVVVLGVLVVPIVFRPDPIERDRKTLCRSEGPSSIMAILLDRTDSFGPNTKSDLKNQIIGKLDSTKENDEISVFTVDSMHKKSLEPIIQVCNPGDPDSADPLISNPEKIRRHWKEKFRQPLEDVLNDLLEEKESPYSPIMESVQSVSITHFQSTKRRSIPRRLIIISDLLQNSGAISFYRDQPNFDRFKRTLESRGLNPDLRGVDIELWLIQRRQPQQGDGGTLLRFFKSWLSEHGGTVVRVLRTSGIND